MAFSALQFLFLCSIIAITTSGSICGSLITYRQYSDIVEKGTPACFLRGCGLSKNASISSECLQHSPCSDLWTTIGKHSGLNWCATCGKDIACRTRGWPIINATELCQSVPSDWMYLSKNCCVSNLERVEIANWIKELCTQEWRQNFSEYGGMARNDWIEWILPWNWTVRYDNSAGEENIPPKCSSPSKYLFVFMVESFVTTIGLIMIPYIQVTIHYSDMWRSRNSKWEKYLRILRLLVVMVKITWIALKYVLLLVPRQLWKCFKWVIHFRESNDRGRESFDEAIQALLMAFVWAALNVGATVGNTFYLKSISGFDKTPSGELAALWLARPNLSWIVCASGVISRNIWATWASHLFKTTDVAWIDQLFTRASYSAAVNEVIMEILGALYLGKTANVGRLRHFYFSHQLWPFYRGHHARTMYNGALVFLIGFPFLVPFWWYIAWRFGRHVLIIDNNIQKNEKWRREKIRIFRNWRARALKSWSTLWKKESKSVKKPQHIYHPPNRIQQFLNKYVVRGWLRTWLRQCTPEESFRKFLGRHVLRSPLADLPQQPLSRTSSIRFHRTPKNAFQFSNRPEQESIWNPYGEILPLRRPSAGRPENEPLINTLEPEPLSQDAVKSFPYPSQPLDQISIGPHDSIPEFTSSHFRQDSNSAFAPDRRPTRPPQSRQETLYFQLTQERERRKSPINGSFDDISCVSGLGSAPTQNPANDPPYEITRPTISRTLEHSGAHFVQDKQATTYDHELPDEPGDPRSKSFWRYTIKALKKWEEIHARERKNKTLIEQLKLEYVKQSYMYLVLTLGIWSYGSQWAFWEGFVHTASDRYCPPNIGYITLSWAAVALLGLCAVFLGNGGSG